MAKKLFKTSGFREFEKALLELATKDARRIARRAVRNAAQPIHDDYQASTHVQTGALVGSEVVGTKLNRRQRKLSPRPGPSEVEIHIGTANPAGIMEEFGIHNHANPALTRAWDKHGGETALKAIGRELGEGLEREAKRKKKG